MFVNPRDNIKYIITKVDAFDAFDNIMLAFQHLAETRHFSPYEYYRMNEEFTLLQRESIDILLSHANMTFNSDTTIDIKRIYNPSDNNFIQSTDGYIKITKIEPRFTRFARYNLTITCIFKFISSNPIKAYKHFNEEVLTNSFGYTMNPNSKRHKTIVEKPSITEKFKSWFTTLKNLKDDYPSREIELKNIDP